MNVISSNTSEPRWRTYSSALLFATPALIAWAFACIFLVPKANELSQRAGLEASRFGWSWPVTFFLVYWGRSILLASLAALVLLELVAPWWRRRRKLALGASVWLANVAVLFGLIVLLIIVLVAAPNLGRG